jgi:hypothetical protein
VLAKRFARESECEAAIVEVAAAPGLTSTTNGPFRPRGACEVHFSRLHIHVDFLEIAGYRFVSRSRLPQCLFTGSPGVLMDHRPSAQAVSEKCGEWTIDKKVKSRVALTLLPNPAVSHRSRV